MKLNKKESLLGIDICYIGHVTKEDAYNINSVNPLYLVIPYLERCVEGIVDTDDRNLIITAVNNNDDYDIIAELMIDGVISKNTVISLGYENKKVLSKLNELSKDIEGKIKGLIERCDKIRLSSDVVLPMNRLIKFHALIIVVRCIIMKDGKFYPEIYLDDGLFEVV